MTDMMICPTPGKFNDHCDDCDHQGKHPLRDEKVIKWCTTPGLCPGCIPYEPPDADAPAPIDLVAIRQSVDAGQIGVVPGLVVTTLCDEIGRLRNWYRAVVEQRDEGRRERNDARDASDLWKSRWHRWKKRHDGIVHNRDELSRQLDHARTALAAERETSQISQEAAGSHLRAFWKMKGERDKALKGASRLTDELVDSMNECRELRQQRDKANLEFREYAEFSRGLSEMWGEGFQTLERGVDAVCKMNNTKLDVVERLRGEVAELTGERDALRLRLANTDRDADQLGKMLDECQVSGLAIQRENADLRTRLGQARAMHCAGDDDPDGEELIPLYKCNADDSRPVFCAVSDCRLRTPHSALEHLGCRAGPWWCPMFEDTVECEVVE